jgi:hypothetical protein
MKDSLDLFISHSSDDKDSAKYLKTVLESNGLSVWIDEDSILEGNDLREDIEPAINKAGTFVFLISPSSIAKASRTGEYAGCRHEIEYAAEQGKRIIPILLCYLFEKDEDAVAKLDLEIRAHQVLKQRLWKKFRTQEFDINCDHLLRIIRTKPEYVRQHTDYILDAEAWIKSSKQTDYLVLRGEALERAETWLKEAEDIEKSQRLDAEELPNPTPTIEQQSFIKQCRVLEDGLKLRNRIIKENLEKFAF